MKNIRGKEAEADIEKLIASLSNSKITKSARNKTEFKLGALFVYSLMIKVNKNKLGKMKNYKKIICIYMAEKIKEFRMLYLYYKKNKYPRIEKRADIGLDFYRNIISDKKKNWESSLVYKKLAKHCRTIYTIEEIEKKKYKIKIFK
jgi:hypothetical protein